MIFLSFFVYWFIADYVLLDFESIKLSLINKYGYDIFGFVLFGLRYVAYVLGVFVVYELLRGVIYGRKNCSFVFRLDKGDIYNRCISPIYKKRVILSLIIPFVLLGILPIVLGLLFKNLYLFFIGVLNVLFNVRDIVM